MKKTGVILIGIVLLTGACRKIQFADVERSSGDANFKNYIAVGNSLTQGYADGGVHQDGQENSYPSIIAKQMLLVEPDMNDFRQPTVYGNGSGYIHLEYLNGEITPVSPGDTIGTPTEEDPSWSSWGTTEKTQKYNNLGIAGITLMQCVALDNDEKVVNNGILGGFHISIPPFIDYEVPGNPFARFMDFGDNPHPLLGGGTPIQYVDHIRNSGATFFTCWLGDNDVLGYATSGGIPTEIDGSLIGMGVIEINTLSDPVKFRMKYDSVLTAFSSIGAKGVCATIPDVTVIPYFNTFTVSGIKADKGYNTLWIEENDGSGGAIVREATDEDLILLTAKDDIASGMGSEEANPLVNADVLDKWEVQACRSRTVELNNAIKASAASFGYAVVDMYDFLERMKPGITLEGIGLSPAYIEGGAFSLDGVHLNPRGYAIAANEFIKTINSAYGSNIPLANIGAYHGIVFP